MKKNKKQLNTAQTPDYGNWLFALKTVAAIYAVASVYDIIGLASRQAWYYSVYDYLPADALNLRYLVSWLWSLLSVAAGVGLFFVKRPARTAVIIMSGLTIACAYWRHPYAALLKHTQSLDLRYPRMFAGHEDLGMSFARLTGTVIFLQITMDVLLSAALIYFLTRPKVKYFFSS